ncbi:MAG: DUF3536 domain-containing protein [Acidobacteria bacterium]|nr:DUF3536 domain-containing protein [Acidobacteriota bacterium]
MKRFICIHGHFYQPPRENPWLETVEVQDSAQPYHDWNERITAECFGPNSSSRILNPEGRIIRIVNNYSKMSFNFGPTLLSWLESHSPQIYRAVLEADRESRRNFSGHGSALAQAYNHMILPLANLEDKKTQVLWGIRDFEYRYGRRPDGMWLPETAVDLETLDLLASLGLRFTLLSPYQAVRVRKLGERQWADVSNGKIDPLCAYRVTLPSGRSLALFFYDAPIARAVAFEHLLASGVNFAHRLLAAFSEKQDVSQLVNIATDGETYGHHHRHGDMALAYALYYIEQNKLARLTNYGEFLAMTPPSHQVEILESSSWSCAHGVERWRSNCGCKTGGKPDWNQEWRLPLRQAMDWLRDTVAPWFFNRAKQYLKDPWVARNEYIDIVLDRSAHVRDRFLHRHALRTLNSDQIGDVLKLMELQRHAMLMYTSCGWFFNDISGIETVQVLNYAGRVIQLAQELFGVSLEASFVSFLEKAKSNLGEQGNGRDIYQRTVKAKELDLKKVGAHFALSSVFQEYPERARIYCYTVHRADWHNYSMGTTRLVMGRAKVTSEITAESSQISFAVLYFGEHNLNCGVQEAQEEQSYQAMAAELRSVFGRADLPEMIRVFDDYFGSSKYTLTSLFRDEQRRIVDLILESRLRDAEAIYRQLYNQHAALMRLLVGLQIPLPRIFRVTSDFLFNRDLSAALAERPLNYEQVSFLLEEAGNRNISLDASELSYALKGNFDRMMEELALQPDNPLLLNELVKTSSLFQSLPFEVDIWHVQNLYYGMLKNIYPDFHARGARGDIAAQEWVAQFTLLGQQLSFEVEKAYQNFPDTKMVRS